MAALQGKRLGIKFYFLIVAYMMISAGIAGASTAESNLQSELPQKEVAFHTAGRIQLAISNFGTFGGAVVGDDFIDPFSGLLLKPWGSEYPKGSGIIHIFGGDYLVGAIKNGDTLVSRSSDREFNPLVGPQGAIVRRSIHDAILESERNAVSEQDFIYTAVDTFRYGDLPWLYYDEYDRRGHLPLGLEISVRSFAWSYEYAEDFVIFDVSIRNVGDDLLEAMYFGLSVEPEVGMSGLNDDYCGFVGAVPSPAGCNLYANVDMVWSADNDGDPHDGEFLDQPYLVRSARQVMATRFLNEPATSRSSTPARTFNWILGKGPREDIKWDFGPQLRQNLRINQNGGTGYGLSDRGDYYKLSNGEIDYDMPYIGEISTYSNWLYPDQEVVAEVRDGKWHGYTYGIGPFDVSPGARVPIVFAVVGGENFHTYPNNLSFLYHDRIDEYYANLDFSDLVKNAIWAEWIYDNPGVDTDSDGFAGTYHICVHDSIEVGGNWIPTQADTIWVKGDGIPDWKAAGPPPAPDIWVTPIQNGIQLRFNGARSENTKDVFSRIIDFEGYRVYLGRDTREQSFSLIASYDRPNYDKWVFNPAVGINGLWQVTDIPYTADSLRCLYGRGEFPCEDDAFDPLDYTPQYHYSHPEFPDSLFYFSVHDYNVSELGFSTPIEKTYPDEPDPAMYADGQVPAEAYTEDGYLKYYEYEMTIESLLPTVPYWVNVTAFDFGSPKSGLPSLETSVVNGAQKVYPLTEGAAAGTGELNVYIYPNPYRIDGSYRDRGYEGRLREDRADNRVREVNFENLPPRCTISIFTLDGDLVRRIEHDVPEGDPNYHHDSWDLITRNTQEPVSGLYYWVVEASDGRTQIGKLVLIM